jgi:hypothetical protein
MTSLSATTEIFIETSKSDHDGDRAGQHETTNAPEAQNPLGSTEKSRTDKPTEEGSPIEGRFSGAVPSKSFPVNTALMRCLLEVMMHCRQGRRLSPMPCRFRCRGSAADCTTLTWFRLGIIWSPVAPSMRLIAWPLVYPLPQSLSKTIK